ncbi:MAG TPA: solute carrier family 23 protein [Syntrophales bacterium]|nr:solute carrier family 23 protein [Syntrophales bacterium]HOL58788.1 solute carrier family 23 protein [Syntrophales bacterium]HPO35115.1 solute carrier family 23 protein [Syntrophales bacterium]
MELRYHLDDLPPWKDTFFNGLQWFVVAIPIIVILGKVTSEFHGAPAISSIIYLQRLVFVMGVTMCVQILWGHGLPLVVGPSTALLVGLAGSGARPEAAYTAIMAGGGVVFMLGVTGAFRYVRRFFTHRVVVTIIFLIAVSLMPTVIKLIHPSGGHAFFTFLFTLLVIISTVILHGVLRGIARQTVIIWVMVGASIIYYLLFPGGLSVDSAHRMFSLNFFSFGDEPCVFDFGVFVSFFFCFFALTINDVGSVQSVNELLHPQREETRLSRSLTVTGLANIVSGVFGVIGPVNYSLSPGVIASSRCASRYPLLITAGLLVALSLSPGTIMFIGYLPTPVIGAVLAYLLGAQVQMGITMWWEEEREMDFDRGLLVIVPVIVAMISSFLSPSFLSGISPAWRPIAGNGFVWGLISSFVLEGFARWKRGHKMQ